MISKTIIGILISLVAINVFAQTNEEEPEPEFSLTPLPELSPKKQRLFIARTTGDVSKAYVKRTTKQSAGRAATILLLGSLSPLSDKIKSFPGSIEQFRMTFKLFTYNENQLFPIASFRGDDVAYFIDLDKGTQQQFIFGLSYSGYDPDVGKINFQFEEEYTHVLVMGRQEETVDQEQLNNFNEELRQQAERDGDDSFSAKAASGKWGISIIQLEQDDANFCEGLRRQTLDEYEFKKRILQYSEQFTRPDRKNRSDPLFNLACVAIAQSKIAPKAKKRDISRAKKTTKQLSPYISHVTEAELKREYIKIKKHQ